MIARFIVSGALLLVQMEHHPAAEYMGCVDRVLYGTPDWFNKPEEVVERAFSQCKAEEKVLLAYYWGTYQGDPNDEAHAYSMLAYLQAKMRKTAIEQAQRHKRGEDR